MGEGTCAEMGIRGVPCGNRRGETAEVQVGGCHFHFKLLDTQQGEQSGAASRVRMNLFEYVFRLVGYCFFYC